MASVCVYLRPRSFLARLAMLREPVVPPAEPACRTVEAAGSSSRCFCPPWWVARASWAAEREPGRCRVQTRLVYMRRAEGRKRVQYE